MKIGMLDYDLNEWHAENYPDFFRRFGDGRAEVSYVYAIIDGEKKNRRQWAEEHGVTLCSTIEEIVARSDGLIVLSPDNPEFHPVLSEQALASGKRVFIDKTFSSDYAEAKAMFDRADAHGTPCYSASALCFADEYKPLIGKADAVSSIGVAAYPNYAVHQIDPILSVMREKADCVWTDEPGERFNIVFESGRAADFRMNQSHYAMTVTHGGKTSSVTLKKDFWSNCIREMSRFFTTGELPIDHDQTLEAMAIREAGLKAMERPGEKIYLKEIRG